ncbi:MAG TPA: 30S ribosome-binding factor RbfA [Flavobacteriales bacterium]|nr:30S ribosome-binding factor RbfA [Flavobacteriales bacterium]
MSSIRQNKVAALIQRELGNYFLIHSRSKYAGAMISVTVVRVTPDLAQARVYVSIFGGTAKKDDVFAIIENNNREIRANFAQATKSQLRATPTFLFILDDSIEYASEIDRLLKKK